METLELEVDIKVATAIKLNILCAEWLWICAEGESNRVIAGSDANESGSKEDHQQPAEEAKAMNTPPWSLLRVVALFHEAMSFFMRNFHINTTNNNALNCLSTIRVEQIINSAFLFIIHLPQGISLHLFSVLYLWSTVSSLEWITCFEIIFQCYSDSFSALMSSVAIALFSCF